MKKLTLRINFFWDDGEDMQEFTLKVPSNVTIDQVKDTLIKTHDHLDMNDDTNSYNTSGRNPVTLLDYVCRKHGWEWESLSFDIDLNLN